MSQGASSYRPAGAGTGAAADVPDGAGRWILLLACLLALVRLWRLGEWSLWHDEALALSDALDRGRLDNPLGYALFGLLLELFDGRPDEFWLRFLPALFGILCVPLSFWAFRPFAGGRRSAVAALLLAASSWHVYWSQNARFYTLAQLLALLGGGLVLRGCLRSRAGSVAAGLTLVALAATAHPSAAFLFAALVVAPWLARAVGLPPSPGGGMAWGVLLVGGVGALLAASGWMLGVWETWVEKKAPNPAHFLLTMGFYVTPLLGTAALVGAVVGVARRSTFDVLVVLVCACALAGALLAGLFGRMSAQYAFVLLPWIAVVATAPLGGRGAAKPPALGAGARAALVALLVLPQLADLGLYFTVRNGERPRWREAYRYVFDHRRPDDLILGMEAPVGEYYLDPDPRRTRVRRWRTVTFLDRFRADLADRWARYPRRTWFVVNFEQLEDWGRLERDLLEQTLRRDCRLMEVFPVHVAARDLDVLVFLRE